MINVLYQGVFEIDLALEKNKLHTFFEIDRVSLNEIVLYFRDAVYFKTCDLKSLIHDEMYESPDIQGAYFVRESITNTP